MKISLLLMLQILVAFALSSEIQTKIKKSSINVAKAVVELKKIPLTTQTTGKLPENKLTKIELNVLDKNLNNVTPAAFNKLNIMKFLKATGTIILAGLFDRSFFITTLMAIKYSKTIVLISASASLTVIGIIAVYLGIAINKYIPVIWIESVAVCLFLAFGGHMIYDALNMENHSHAQDLEKEIGVENDSEKNNNENVTNVNVPINIKDEITEANKISKCIVTEKTQNLIEIKSAPVENQNCDDYSTLLDNNKSNHDRQNLKIFNENEISESIEIPKVIAKKNFFSMLYNNETIKVFVKVFILIFFSEIGDRSQISTIYLTTTFDKFIVLLGVIFSSVLLSILAVFGGKLISNRISEKNLTMMAGVSFLLFGIGALVMLIFECEDN